jgi:hypothetical protein
MSAKRLCLSLDHACRAGHAPNKVWEDLAVPGVSGNPQVSVDYAGPKLTSGMIYQFRATSIKKGGTAIATTEDLKGVFLYK